MSDWKYLQDKQINGSIARTNEKTGAKELYNYQKKKWVPVPKEMVHDMIYDHDNLREISEEQAAKAIQQEAKTIKVKK